MGVVKPQVTKPVEFAVLSADIAIYAAQYLGKNRYQILIDVMHAHVMGHMEPEPTLRRAIDDHSSEIWFQPIVHASTGRAVRMEALASLRINGKFCPLGLLS
jgi:predicted signal transduction protein with EAL and GGDEF domain